MCKYTKEHSKYICVGSKHKGSYLSIEDILFIKAYENYTWLYLFDGSKHLSCKSLGYYQTYLKRDNFIRIHRSYLINLLHIKYYDAKYRLVHLKGEITLSVSHRKSREFSESLQSA